MHAYLIIAHNEFGILEKLIKMLDHEKNDLYIHIDKAVSDFDFEYFKSIAKKSKLQFTDRIHISWGDHSMICAEYILLEAAVSSGIEYKYLNLISGVDLPLKSADELVEYFDNLYPKQLIHFAGELNAIESSRVRHYHFFTGRRNVFNRLMTKFEQIVQTILHIDRQKGIKVKRGSQWFSITRDFAKHLVDNKTEIIKKMKHTFIPDEFFVQTQAFNSKFIDSLDLATYDDSNEQNMRYIDWTRGHPYTFCEEDFDDIMNSGFLFVRKLTDKNKLPEMIYNKVINNI